MFVVVSWSLLRSKLQTMVVSSIKGTRNGSVYVARLGNTEALPLPPPPPMIPPPATMLIPPRLLLELMGELR